MEQLSHSADHEARAFYAGAPDWPVRPHLPGRWMEIDGPEASGVIRAVDSAATGSPMKPPFAVQHRLFEMKGVSDEIVLARHDIQRIRVQQPAFLPDHLVGEMLVRVHKEDTLGIIRFVTGPRTVILDGEGETIKQIARRAPADLGDRGKVHAYARFFAANMCAEAGFFHVIADPAAIRWTEEATTDLIAEASQTIDYGGTSEPEDDNADYMVRMTLCYDQDLFVADLAVSPDGQSVEMLDEQRLLPNTPKPLPITADRFEHGIWLV